MPAGRSHRSSRRRRPLARRGSDMRVAATSGKWQCSTSRSSRNISVVSVSTQLHASGSRCCLRLTTRVRWMPVSACSARPGSISSATPASATRPGEPGSQPARERLDDLLDGRREGGRGIAAGHPAVGVARRGVAAAEIELARLPAAPRLRELGNGLAGAERVLAPRLDVVAVPAEVRHEPEHVELGCRERVAAGRDQLVGRDAGLVLLRGLVDGCLREVGPLLQREVARSHAEAHLRRAPELTSDGAHELDLADAVERDARADADRLGEQRPRLARAVDGDQLLAAHRRRARRAARPGRRRRSRGPPA